MNRNPTPFRAVIVLSAALIAACAGGDDGPGRAGTPELRAALFDTYYEEMLARLLELMSNPAR